MKRNLLFIMAILLIVSAGAALADDSNNWGGLYWGATEQDLFTAYGRGFTKDMAHEDNAHTYLYVKDSPLKEAELWWIYFFDNKIGFCSFRIVFIGEAYEAGAAILYWAVSRAYGKTDLVDKMPTWTLDYAYLELGIKPEDKVAYLQITMLKREGKK